MNRVTETIQHSFALLTKLVTAATDRHHYPIGTIPRPVLALRG
jgi:hypothetical protein